VFSELAGDASELYATRKWGFEIDPSRVLVRQIARGLKDAAAALAPWLYTLTRDEYDVLAYAFAGLWTRTGWGSWPTLDDQPALLRLLPPAIAARSEAEVARVRRARSA
jgi:hypothetical protein